MKQAEITVRVDLDRGGRARRPCGPATSRTTTSRSTPNTGPETVPAACDRTADRCRAPRLVDRIEAGSRSPAAPPSRTGTSQRVRAGASAAAAAPLQPVAHPHRSRPGSAGRSTRRRSSSSATRASSSRACPPTTCCSPVRAAPASRRWSRRCSREVRREGPAPDRGRQGRTWSTCRTSSTASPRGRSASSSSATT